ncbi:MAG TPA: hypothetical protein VH540_27915 [Ktedonobacterales bacterium]|jgi:hypothetical protein
MKKKNIQAKQRTRKPTPTPPAKSDGAVELTDNDLETAQGGLIPLLLPAIQKIREL